MNLGIALMRLGWRDEATASYREALRIDPASAQAHNNLGNALKAKGQLESAIISYREALRIDPEYAAAHSNLGVALETQGKLDEAEASYQEALRIDPDFTDAHGFLGQALQKLGRFDEAIPHFEATGTPIAKANVLECLFAAGRTAPYTDYLSELCRSDPVNIRAAAVSAFAAHQWDTDNPYPFCKNPMDFIYTTNLHTALAPFDGFVASILEEIEDAPALWDPEGNAVRGGFHTIGNLFQMETPAISVLRKALWERIEDYRSRYADRDDGLIRQWPRACKLTGWHVKLLESGHMVPHIHTSGWLSGVIYLKIPGNLDGGQGAITFSLHGYDYPIRNDDIPKVQHMPKEGDLLLFPSSLFHFTAPFASDDARQCISFDIYPQGSKD
jgi:tetratricopeptide (TPR) repeat protein